MVHSKCYISINREPKQVISTHPFNKQVDFILPLAAYNAIQAEFHSKLFPEGSPPLVYHRLKIPLSAILEKEFFNKYIKIGNVIMLSEGRIDTDNVYCLSEGKLRLSLTKESYEKSGLVGTPAKFGGGRKGQRWNLEYDLRSDKMMHGTKQLERLVWSFSEVLTGAVTFLFCDLGQIKRPSQPSQSQSQSQKLQPVAPCPILESLSSTPRLLKPDIHTTPLLTVPSMKCPPGLSPRGSTEYATESWKEWILEQFEWLSLVSLDADRIKAGDEVDPYLSTYQVPEALEEPMKVVRVRWRGLVPAGLVGEVWRCSRELMKSHQQQIPEEASWMALTVVGFENSPISWEKSEHGNLTGGENCYTILSTYLQGEKGDDDDGNGGDEDGDAMEVDSDGKRKETVYLFEVVGSKDEHS